MGSWIDTISGHGSAELDGGAGQFPYAWESFSLTATSPRVRLLSAVEPLQYQFVGSIGLAELSSGQLIVKYFHPLRFSHEFRLTADEVAYVTHAFWKLPASVGVDLVVYW